MPSCPGNGPTIAQPERTAAREELLGRVAGLLPVSAGDDCVRVGIDGVDGSGKTIFADELAETPRDAGRAGLRTAPAGAVLVVDGLFLQREVLADAWHLSIFPGVPFEVNARRMAARDGTNPDPRHPSMARYVDAQRLYFADCAPRERADIVIDNALPGAPRFIRSIRPGRTRPHW